MKKDDRKRRSFQNDDQGLSQNVNDYLFVSDIHRLLLIIYRVEEVEGACTRQHGANSHTEGRKKVR